MLSALDTQDTAAGGRETAAERPSRTDEGDKHNRETAAERPSRTDEGDKHKAWRASKATRRARRAAESQAPVDILNAAVALDAKTSGVTRWYGALNGVQATFFFDTGASRCFIGSAAADRMGLRSSAAEPLSVRHSSGAVEVATRMVRGARLELHPGWAVLLDLYVLTKFPDVDLIVGADFMASRHTHLKMLPDASMAVELTVGRRRLQLAPGANEVYAAAIPRRVQQLAGNIDEGDEVVLAFVHGHLGIAAEITAMDASPTGAEAPQDWQQEFEERLAKMRGEESAALSAAEQERWAAILAEYWDVFQEPDYTNTAAPKMNETLGVHYIPLYEDATLPRNERRGNFSDEKVASIVEYIRILLDKGFIQPSDSPLGAPVLLIRKPDGSWRFTVDYRAINHITRDDNYLPPKPDTLYPQLKGAKVFARVDARDGFWGIPMAKQDRWKTAFQTPIGLYEWTVMPMGLKGSPARFQRYMDWALRRYIGKCCVVFVDDIVVYADSVSQLMDRLKDIFETLRQHRIRLKQSKCAFFLTAVRFLGHIVDGDGMTPDRDKVRVLAEMPAPVSIGDVRSLMGVVGFLRGYVPRVVEHLAPIQALLKKGTKITWTPEHQIAKDAIVEALVSSAVLALPDARRRKALMTDASDYAMGAVLLQDHSDEKQEPGEHDNSVSSAGWRPVAFLSKALTAEQARQAPTTREFFAMAEAVSKWETEMANQSSVVVFSDHKPLEALSSGRGLNRMIMRRLDDLANIDLQVVYKPAAEVGMADWLSRRPDHRALNTRDCGDGHPWLTANLTMLALGGDVSLWDRLREAQRACPRVQEILSQDRHTDEWRTKYKEHRGMLWSVASGRMLAVVPAGVDTEPLRHDIIRELHDTPLAGHLGPAKTYERVARHFTWKGLRRDVDAYCVACNTCQRTKPAAHALQGKRFPLPVPKRKGAWMSLDFVTALPASRSPEGGQVCDAVLVVVDKLHKRARFIATHKAVTSEETAHLYFKYVAKDIGFPQVLVSDRDPKFTAGVWQDLWRLAGTTLNMSTAAHAQTDGQSEGMIRVLEQMLRAYAQDMGDDWARWLPALEFAYNDSQVRTTGQTPFFLEYGQHPATPLAMELGELPDSQTLRDMQKAIRSARKRLVEVTEREAAAENTRRRAINLAPGEWVYLKKEKGARGKLDDLWEGPYKVLQVPLPNVVEVALPGNRHERINVEHVKKHVHHAEQIVGLGKSIARHRIFTADDAVQELQFLVNGRWHSLQQLVQEHGRWADVQQYCESAAVTPVNRVGQLVRRRYRPGYFLGRVAFFDPDDDTYQVIYSDKDADTMSPAEVDKYAYTLRGSRGGAGH